MTQPRRTNSYSREPDLEGLDPSSAWVGDESAVIPPVALEPYDFPPEDDKIPFTQVIPIPPPLRDGSAKSRRSKRKADSPETSVLIPVEKVAPGQTVRKNGPQPATALPPPPTHVAPIQPPRVTRALPRPKRMRASVLLLLLSVVVVFIFAYIAQK
ncbi:MAG TPA: hypothetical protein VJ810_15505 [Blastocatellia bacterium]|nr:hypothetical protein [Blastocatellia bacterium]